MHFYSSVGAFIVSTLYMCVYDLQLFSLHFIFVYFFLSLLLAFCFSFRLFSDSISLRVQFVCFSTEFRMYSCFSVDWLHAIALRIEIVLLFEYTSTSHSQFILIFSYFTVGIRQSGIRIVSLSYSSFFVSLSSFDLNGVFFWSLFFIFFALLSINTYSIYAHFMMTLLWYFFFTDLFWSSSLLKWCATRKNWEFLLNCLIYISHMYPIIFNSTKSCNEFFPISIYLLFPFHRIPSKRRLFSTIKIVA